ncbi:ATP-binding cassette domain-containing protein (plasmid) [Nicoliella spurrieriana]|uniref:ATP-binding cassette domain-containing protein n=1 Tax=Nicoliella spurrieriana TaxID=2925830 RepID=A0A976X537_9LACO|nr:ATP-binding cassette domain-containing protein [Nicoliella spurrieriana]UQS86221.1 ATP-binding cassette domain-containing protein [Nicoliella spurrieriana]
MKNIFSHQLITLRRQKKLSQSSLANKLYVARQSISKWENGDSDPSIENLINLAEIFNVDLDYLVFGTNNADNLVLKLSQIQKSFYQPVLKGVDLEIYSRDRIALLGSNGSGKSTLFKIIIGLMKADSGRIENHINNLDSLNVMPQDNVLIDSFKLNEQVQLTAAINKITSKTFIQDMIKKFSLTPYINTNVSKLSGGQKRRLSLLLSLLRPSKLLLLDEPTVGMDLETIDFFWNYLDHVSGSVVTVTHDFNQIDKFFSRVVLLKNGIIDQNVSVDTIHSHNQTIEQWYRHFND